MIRVANTGNNKINFGGTTIIKKEGGSILTKEITDAVNKSRPGFLNTRLNGYSIISVADVFEKVERNFLKELTKKGLAYANFSKVVDHRTTTRDGLLKMIEGIKKTGLLG